MYLTLETWSDRSLTEKKGAMVKGYAMRLRTDANSKQPIAA